MAARKAARWLPCAVTLLTCLQPLSNAARAEGLDPSATFAVTRSDNLLRARTGEVGDTVVDAGVGVNVAAGGRIFRLDGDAAFRHREFLENSAASDNLPAVNLRGRAIILPEILTWIADESMGQIAPQPFESLTRNDQQNASFFSTGPSLYLPLGSRTRVEADLRYGLVNYSGSGVDTRRYTGEIGLGRLLGRTGSVSVNYSAKKLEYELDGFPSSTSDAAFLRYSLDSLRTQLVGEVGAESSRIGNGARSREPHLLAGLQRRVSRRTTLNVEVSHGYSDAGENLRLNLRDTFNNGGVQNVLAVAEPFKSDRGYANLVRRGNRLMVAVQIDGSRERYITRTSFDRNIYGAGLAVDYQLTPLTTAAVKYAMERENLVDNTRSSRYQSVTLGVNRQFGRAVRCTLAFQHLQASGSVDSYRENRALFSLTYSPRPPRRVLFDPAGSFRYFDRTMRSAPSMQPSAPVAPLPDAQIPGAEEPVIRGGEDQE